MFLRNISPPLFLLGRSVVSSAIGHLSLMGFPCVAIFIVLFLFICGSYACGFARLRKTKILGYMETLKSVECIEKHMKVNFTILFVIIKIVTKRYWKHNLHEFIFCTTMKIFYNECMQSEISLVAYIFLLNILDLLIQIGGLKQHMNKTW